MMLTTEARIVRVFFESNNRIKKWQPDWAAIFCFRLKLFARYLKRWKLRYCATSSTKYKMD
ncbi:hypothetical protein [Vibrio gallaecicus]|uniref:hypothetical protein n=1 Tax=Vibrio gallaecicus TaxID=552386 RepID=UPI0025B5AC23|nr:hypothetical protein [Vibrio gallaecicus]MDN3616091.1 hypothetical protein [Vibrio gallaecicus]